VEDASFITSLEVAAQPVMRITRNVKRKANLVCGKAALKNRLQQVAVFIAALTDGHLAGNSHVFTLTFPFGMNMQFVGIMSSRGASDIPLT
jgi:hypothetical protein